MKRLLFIIPLLVILFSSPITAFADDYNVNAESKDVASAYLVDADTGTVLYEYNAEEKRPIASMVKIMTLLLVFNALEEGKIKLGDQITISENASAMGGSQMFLEANDVYVIDDLIKGIVVSSANDASVALAEVISGSVEDFVSEMNEYALKLGMNSTKFVNVTGLPGEGQYSTAKDVSIMTRELLKHKVYYNYSKIWIENYKHPDGRVTELVNTNKLVRFYKDCDSGKTGFTNDAMFCLSASAKRDDLRVIATVLGGATSKARFSEVTRLFNYAFSKYEQKCIAKNGDLIDNNLYIKKAKAEDFQITVKENVFLLSRKGDKIDYSVEANLNDNLIAPMKKGDKVGTLIVKDNKSNIVIKESDIILVQDVKVKSYRDAIDEIIMKWW